MGKSARDGGAGFLAGLAAIPTALATALLVFGHLGPAFAQDAVAAAIYSLLVGGTVVALLANSSPVIPAPLIGPNLVLLSLVTVVADQAAGSPNLHILILTALALCVLLGGLWQILLGASGVAAVVNFVPYPVLAGFLDGIAILTVVSQLQPLFTDMAGLHLWPVRPAVLLFVLVLVALIVWFPSMAKRLPIFANIPGPLAALIVGIAVFEGAKLAWPGLNVGRPLGQMDIAFPPRLSLAALSLPGLTASLRPFSFEIVAHSLASAGVATIETFLAMRLAQNAIDAHFSPRRQVAAFGTANAAVACAGGLILSGQPSMTMMAISAGGRTRYTPLAMAATVLLLGILFSRILSIIPLAVLSAILIATGFKLFDPWTVKLIGAVANRKSAGLRRRAFYDLLIVWCVMGMTVFYSVIGGIVAGCVLSCAIFIVRMSQPVVQAVLWDVRSKRVRAIAQAEALNAAMGRSAVLKLQGVLFFGNADELARELKGIQEQAAAIVLDCKKISEIDISGVNALRATLERSRRLGKLIQFCNLPTALVETFADAFKLPRQDLTRDLDITLTQIEDEALRRSGAQPGKAVPLDQIDLLRGLTADEIAEFGRHLRPRSFAPSDIVCREGEDGDRMWLVLSGNLTVGIKTRDRDMHVASLGPGTMVGEMALIACLTRTANVRADDHVECRELSREDFDIIVNERPALAAKLLTNLSSVLAQRLLATNSEFRVLVEEFL